MRTFRTGATRDDDKTKIDPEGFLSPLVIKAFCNYMHKHRVQADGSLRESDNWQKGMDQSVYMKSLWRHFLDLWLEHRKYKSRDGKEEALAGLLFNVMGYWFEELRNENNKNNKST